MSKAAHQELVTCSTPVRYNSTVSAELNATDFNNSYKMLRGGDNDSEVGKLTRAGLFNKDIWYRNIFYLILLFQWQHLELPCL